MLTVKPFYHKEPSDVTVLAGDSVKFQCAVGGDPQPQILWRKDDGHMPVGRYLYSNTYKCLRCMYKRFGIYVCFYPLSRADILEEDKSLVIKNVVPSDEGIYICEAHNSVGQISARAQLGVNCKWKKHI